MESIQFLGNVKIMHSYGIMDKQAIKGPMEKCNIKFVVLPRISDLVDCILMGSLLLF